MPPIQLRPWLARAVRLFVTVGLLGLLLWLVDLSSVAGILISADLWLVGLAVALSLGDRLLMAAKWYPLLRVQLDSVSLLTACRAYLASGVAHYFLPASVGADAVRAVAIGRGAGSVVEVGASIVAERVLGLVASALMALIALVLAAEHGIALGAVVPWALLSVAVGVGALVLPLTQWGGSQARRLFRIDQGGRWGRWADRFGRAYATYRLYPARLLVVGLLSLLEQLFPVVFMWVGAKALGIHIGLGPMVVVLTLTLFAARLPVSFGGLGVGEGALVYLLGLYGIPAAGALALAVLGRAVEIVVNVGPAALFWRDLVRTHHATRGVPKA